MASRPRYRLIDHTADLCIEAREETLEELFASAAFALFDVQVETGRVRTVEAERVEVDADDLVELMIAWLSELQYRFEASKIVFVEFDVQSIDEGKLRALCRGEAYERARHGSLAMVKGITYHQAVVECDGDGWRARLIFDV